MTCSFPGSLAAAAVGQGSVGRTRGIPQHDCSLSYDTEYLALWRAWFLTSIVISGPLLFWASASPSYLFHIQQTCIVLRARHGVECFHVFSFTPFKILQVELLVSRVVTTVLVIVALVIEAAVVETNIYGVLTVCLALCSELYMYYITES